MEQHFHSAWAHALIDQLIQQGAVDFCIAPGSRSTPLALAAARHPKACLTVHFDERGLAFFALGLSKAGKQPAVLIVTSGTAVGNLMPAVMEAYHTHTPLIVLTADRPPELRDCGANQTTDQIKFFQNFTYWQTDLPCPSHELDLAFIRREAAHAVWSARQGPVHLNCPFREPLFTKDLPHLTGAPQKLFSPAITLSPQAKQYLEEKLSCAHRGLILIGGMPFGSDLSSLFELSRHLSWPLFADLLSNARTDASAPSIRHFDFLIRTKKLPRPDFILHFGGRFTSKALFEWVKTLAIPVVHVSAQEERMDPMHCCPHRIGSDPGECAKALQFGVSTERDWLETWQEMDREIGQRIKDYLKEDHPFTEIDLMRQIGRELPDDWAIFLGNSMPIRDAEHFLFPNRPRAFFANRGLSGIDGQIATAAGISMKLNCPMIAILGDQSSLHDLNSCALLKQLKQPFILLISNNFGGGIFSHLPVAEEESHFERLFGMGHTMRFSPLAQLFDLPYKAELCFDSKEPRISEILTSRKENTRIQKDLLNHLTNFCSSLEKS